MVASRSGRSDRSKGKERQHHPTPESPFLSDASSIEQEMENSGSSDDALVISRARADSPSERAARLLAYDDDSSDLEEGTKAVGFFPSRSKKKQKKGRSTDHPPSLPSQLPVKSQRTSTSSSSIQNIYDKLERAEREQRLQRRRTLLHLTNSKSNNIITGMRETSLTRSLITRDGVPPGARGRRTLALHYTVKILERR